MTLWIIAVNIALLVSAAGAISVWLGVAEISSGLALALCFVTVIIMVAASLLIVRKYVATKRKSYLLLVLVPIVFFLCIFIFRNNITGFLFDILMPIGPGGMVKPSELMT